MGGMHIIMKSIPDWVARVLLLWRRFFLWCALSWTRPATLTSLATNSSSSRFAFLDRARHILARSLWKQLLQHLSVGFNTLQPLQFIIAQSCSFGHLELAMDKINVWSPARVWLRSVFAPANYPPKRAWLTVIARAWAKCVARRVGRVRARTRTQI